LRKFALGMAAAVVLLSAGFARSQETDVAFGLSALLSPKYTSSSQLYLPPSEKSGAYLSLSGERRFRKRLGFSGEFSWREKQGLYNGFQRYRPLLYDVNAVFAPRLGENASMDLMAGAGGESLRFYNQFSACTYPAGCLTHLSATHFMTHVGVDVRYYFRGSLFIRPEFHYYAVRDNFEFHSGNLFRAGASVGYTFGRK